MTPEQHIIDIVIRNSDIKELELAPDLWDNLVATAPKAWLLIRPSESRQHILIGNCVVLRGSK